VSIQAVIFDLFGTLVDDFIARAAGIDTQMAAALDLPADEFLRVWKQTLDMRILGAFQSVEANLEHVLEALRARARPEQIARAVEIRMDCIKRALSPVPDAVSVLRELQRRSYKLGLVSNCSIEIPLVWHETAFAPYIDQPVFSSRVRLKKPDPRIYGLACESLEVSPESCLYVADGENYELAAALSAGLRPVLVRSAAARRHSEIRREALEWRGAAVADLAEIPRLLDTMMRAT
jgi:putative hydrolase of the HAD superfamily